MARPIKKGLDYFPLNVDVDQDDKFQLVEAVHGIEGFGITIQLLMRIYKEGFYYKWTENEQILFARRVNVNINKVTDVVNDCIKYGVFNQDLYDEHNILTSKGIQERYFEATTRRKSVVVDKEFIVIDTKSYPNVQFKGVNVDINANSPALNVVKSTQSKGEEIREEKKDKDADAKAIFDYYISKNIIRHKVMTTSMKGKINTALKNYGMERLKKIIDNYHVILRGNQYYFDTEYTLEKLLRPKDLAQFDDEAKPLYNFLKDKGKAKQNASSVIKASNSIDASDLLEGMDWN